MTKLSTVKNEFDCLLRAKQCAELCGMGLSTWWRFVQNGIAPKPVKIGSRFTAWRASDVQNFIEDVVSGKFENGGVA